MPWHSETKPSFIVWTNQEYENFYCFGCQSKHNIIHLVSHLESISVKKAIEKLSDGMEFSIADEEKLEQETVLNEVNIIGTTKSKAPTAEVAKSLIEMSDMCHMFLKGVDHEPDEQKRIDKVWSIVDDCLRNYEFDKIENMRREIGPMLRQQRELLRRNYVERLKEKYDG